MSIGKPAQHGDPEVVAAEKFTIETALKMGKNPRVELRDPGQAAKYLDMGVQHFCIGWDVRILADWWDTKGAEMRGLVEGKAAPVAKPVKVAGNYS
jgi:2-keto-3-deoxy-L-rhamnonate aldolase RhmA